MKKYNVTVNGVTYEVLVEEAGEVSGAPAAPAPAASSAPAATAATPVATAPKAAPAPAPKASPAPAAAPAPASNGTPGSIKVTAPMPGTILKLNVKVGDTLKANDLVCILEAMKMENEIFTSEGGVVKSIESAQGASVNAGDVIITLG
ncbi:MAG: biotin/lipoyl-containing protein [Eubacteriales bacterium]